MTRPAFGLIWWSALAGAFPTLPERLSSELEGRDLTTLFEELAEALAAEPAPAQPAVLVLDDYHLITNAALHTRAGQPGGALAGQPAAGGAVPRRAALAAGALAGQSTDGVAGGR